MICLDRDLNEFLTSLPEANNVFWVPHNPPVDEAMTTQKEIIRKVIDTIGGRFKRTLIRLASRATVSLMNFVRRPGSKIH